METDMIPAWVEGRLTPVDKLEVHRRGLRHPAVSVFVRAGDAFLWQQRAAVKYHSGLKWANTCCTHPGWGEDPLACAHRRLAEELGITGLTLRPMGQVEYRADVGGGLTEHERVDVFLADPAERPHLALNPDEVAATEWLTLDQVDAAIARAPDRFTPWVRLYLSDHRAELFGTNAAVENNPRSP